MNESRVYLLPEGVQIAKLIYGYDAIVFGALGPYIDLHPEDATALSDLTHESIMDTIKSICDAIQKAKQRYSLTN